MEDETCPDDQRHSESLVKHCIYQGRIQDFEIGGSSIHHARETRQLGGSGGMPPQKNFGIQIVSDAIWDSYS